MYSEQPLSAATLRYRDAAGNKSAKSKAFEWVSPEPTKPFALLSLIPISMDEAMGIRDLTVSLTEGDHDYTEDFLFDIEPRTVPVYDLYLNEKLTTLTTTPTKRKAIESNRLSEILCSRDPSGVYLFDGLIRPFANGVITSGFGDTRRYRYSNGKSSSSMHIGIDYRAKKGTPIYAPGRGKVVLAQKRELTGNSVVIEHLPGLYSLYYHLDSIAVKEGRVIERGALIGRAGMTGFATGTHLHWELRLDGVPIDPEDFSLESQITIK
jgi:murein DD-endopeptidase MepM/ murein hydrolase activator NlpD